MCHFGSYWWEFSSFFSPAQLNGCLLSYVNYVQVEGEKSRSKLAESVNIMNNKNPSITYFESLSHPLL